MILPRCRGLWRSDVALVALQIKGNRAIVRSVFFRAFRG